MRTISINGVEFIPNPECKYAHDYLFLAERVAEKDPDYPEMSTWRALIQQDLWFLLFFVVKPFADEAGKGKVNHPFVVNACREIETGPADYTLDIWARFHFKSSIITTAETIQYQLKNPDHATGIFSHKAPIAKDFLGSIKSIFENEKILYYTFPDVVWEDCRKDSPKWSEDEGIVLKRKTNRREASISAHGLVEGMPTGLHFERRIYDDISTNDMANSPEQIENVKKAFDVSSNLKTMTGSHHRVVGTYYSHMDPLLYVRDMKRIDGTPMYFLRFKPATEDGTINGKPVLMDQAALDDEKPKSSFNCQQLLDPTPSSEQKLNPDFLKKIEVQFIPKTVYKFMLIDQAGDATTNKSRDTDAWAIGIFGVEPVVDDIGQSNVYIQDLWVEVAGESEAIDQAVRMYIENGMICKVGVEKVGTTTTHLHIQNALKARGRYVHFDNDIRSTGVLLRPAGRNKKKFIEGALAWPLNNGKLFYSSKVNSRYIDRLKQEMSNHPLWHDDAMNVMAYLYDILRDYTFAKQQTEEEKIRANLEHENYNPLLYGLNEEATHVRFIQ